jgi:hypothetical protein
MVQLTAEPNLHLDEVGTPRTSMTRLIEDVGFLTIFHVAAIRRDEDEREDFERVRGRRWCQVMTAEVGSQARTTVPTAVAWDPGKVPGRGRSRP